MGVWPDSALISAFTPHFCYLWLRYRLELLRNSTLRRHWYQELASVRTQFQLQAKEQQLELQKCRKGLTHVRAHSKREDDGLVNQRGGEKAWTKEADPVFDHPDVDSRVLESDLAQVSAYRALPHSISSVNTPLVLQMVDRLTLQNTHLLRQLSDLKRETKRAYALHLEVKGQLADLRASMVCPPHTHITCICL